MYEHVMKALRNLALTLMVPVLVSSLSAAEKPEIIDEYLPVGKMAEASAVSVVLDESLQPFMEKIDGVFASLPDKDKKELSPFRMTNVWAGPRMSMPSIWNAGS